MKQETCELCGDVVKNGKCSCKNEKPVKIYFCPKCKNKNVKYGFRLQNIFGLLPRMYCNKCGFSAQQFPILVVPAKKMRQLNKKAKNKK